METENIVNSYKQYILRFNVNVEKEEPVWSLLTHNGWKDFTSSSINFEKILSNQLKQLNGQTYHVYRASGTFKKGSIKLENGRVVGRNAENLHRILEIPLDADSIKFLLYRKKIDPRNLNSKDTVEEYESKLRNLPNSKLNPFLDTHVIFIKSMLSKAQIPYSEIVRSGYGYYVKIFISFEDQERIEEIREFHKALVSYLNNIAGFDLFDPQCTDAGTRVVRIEGSCNLKNPKIPRQVRSIEDNGNFYNLDELIQIVPQMERVDYRPETTKTYEDEFPKKEIIDICKKYYFKTNRNNLIYNLSAFIFKNGGSQDDALAIIEALALEHEDDEKQNRLTVVKNTYKKFQTGVKIKGYEGLKNILSEEDLTNLTCLFSVEPDTIPFQRHEVLPFPIEVFPQKIQEILTEVAKAINAPLDFLALPLIAGAGSIIGTTRVIQIKRGWHERPTIWVAVVDNPGTKKSPAINAMIKPIYRIQKNLESEFKLETEQYLQKLDIYDSELLKWRNSKGTMAKPEKPEEPTMTQIITTDTTIEALADLLERNPRGLIVFRDELIGWALSMDQYKNTRGADRQSWLSFWNGATVIVNRKNRKDPIILHDPLVCVCGSLPPDVLNDLAEERGREDGFIHRILFTNPDPIQKTWTEEEISEDATKNLDMIFQRLFTLEHEVDENGDFKPTIVQFNEDGKAFWKEFIKDHYKEQEESIFPDNLKGPWAKMEGYAARLALILQFLRWACDEADDSYVDDVSMAGAAELIDYFKSHAKRVYDRLKATPEDKRVQSAVEWIRKRGGTSSARDFLTHKVAGVKKASDVRGLFKDIQDRGWGKVEEKSKGRVTISIKYTELQSKCRVSAE